MVRSNFLVFICIIFASVLSAQSVDYSVERGLYSNPVNVQLSTDLPGATIMYTLDSSNPGPGNGQVYSGPIPISFTSSIRSVAFNATDTTEEETHSYLFLDDIVAANYMQPHIINDPLYATQMESSLTSIPIIFINVQDSVQDTLELPISIEFYFPDTGDSKQENAGVKQYGNRSLGFDKKSMRVYFREEYGDKNFKYPLFEGFDNGTEANDKFKNIEFRSGSCSSWLCERDSNRWLGHNNTGEYFGPKFADDLMLKSGHVNVHGRYVHMYVNNEYMGMYHMRERVDEHFMEEYFGGDDDDYDYIDGTDSGGAHFEDTIKINHGTGTEWLSMIANSSNFAAWKNHKMVKQIYDFMLIYNFWYAEAEFNAAGNANTGYVIRVNDNDKTASRYGRFATNINKTDPLFESAGPGQMIRNLYLEGSEDFLTDFGDNIECKCLNDGPLSVSQQIATIEEHEDMLESPIVAESARWGDTVIATPATWQWRVNKIKDEFIPARMDSMIKFYKFWGMYPELDPVEYSLGGSLVPPGFPLQLTNSNGAGDIYYTTNGEDPRLPGGAVNSNAQLYNGTLSIPDGVNTFRARVRKSSIDYPLVNIAPSAVMSINNGHPAFPVDNVVDGNRSSGTRFVDTISYTRSYNQPLMHIDIDLNSVQTVDHVVVHGFLFYQNLNQLFLYASQNPITTTDTSLLNNDPSIISIPTEGFSSLRKYTIEQDVRYIRFLQVETNVMRVAEIEVYQKDLANPYTKVEWSSMCPQRFYTPQNYSDLLINEIHYNPLDSITANDTIDGDEYEFIEIKNNGLDPVNMSDMRLVEGVGYIFPYGTILGPGDFYVIAEDSLDFYDRFNFYPDGVYRGKLNNGGELLSLEDPFNIVIDSVRYSDDPPWVQEPDGDGVSLALIPNTVDNDDPEHWQVQTVPYTPGEENEFCTDFVVDLFVNNVDCNGDATGSVAAIPSGGQLPISYSWSNGAATASLLNVSAGNYSLTAIDDYGCIFNSSIQVNQPAALTINASATDQTYFMTNDGTAAVSASGGTPPYSYQWSTGSNQSSIANLAPGTYMVTVTDDNDCEITASITVDPIVCSTFNFTANITDVGCNGESTGAINLNSLSGGIAPYQFQWMDGSTQSSITNIPEGDYTLEITDNVGCSQSEEFTVNEPLPLSLTHTQNNESYLNADDGSVNMIVNGGTPPYSYQWNTGATTQNVNGLPPGNYAVIVSDQNGCSQVYSIQILAVTCNPLIITPSINHVSCFNDNDGNINIGITGGSTPYSTLWNTGATNASVSNLTAGIYTVNVTDAVGCSGFKNVVVNEPTALNVSVNANNESGLNTGDGSASAVISGGTPPYQYFWSNGQFTTGINNLTPGTYSLTVTDANGCFTVESFNIQSVQCSPIVLSAVTNHVSCYNGSDGSALILASGQNSPFSYDWSTGATQNQIQNASSGTYSCTVTDAIGCTESIIVSINAPALPLALSTSQINESAIGAADGSITLSVTGGTAPYIYTWSNGSNAQNLTNLSPGTYSVNVEDANSCSQSISATISSVNCNNFSVSLYNSDVDCFGDDNGSIILSTSGGSAPFTYLWADGVTTKNRYNLPAGNYSVTITDNQGCILTASQTVNAPANGLQIGFNITNETYSGALDGEAIALVNGGTAPYTYNWSSTNQNVASINGLSAGNYNLTVTDDNDCSSTQNFSVAINNSAPIAMFTVNTNAGSAPLPVSFDATLSVDPDNDVLTYFFDYGDGNTGNSVTSQHTYLNSGTYTASLTVTDIYGQTDTYSEIINVTGNPCADPSGINLVQVTENNISLMWNQGLTQGNYEVQFKLSSSSNWTTINTTQSFVILSNLNTCTNYDIRVRASCNSNFSSYVYLNNISTSGCINGNNCTPIYGLYEQNITDQSAILVWDLVNFSDYNLYYRELGALNWNTYNSSIPFVILFSLNPCTTYEWYIEINCADGSGTADSPIHQFATLGGGCPNRNEDESSINDSLNEILDLKLYPVPAADFVNVEIPLSDNEENFKWRIIDLNGKVIKQGNHSINILSIDISDFPTGLYQIEILLTDQKLIKKFIKQ